jgi:hypothetical protein
MQVSDLASCQDWFTSRVRFITSMFHVNTLCHIIPHFRISHAASRPDVFNTDHRQRLNGKWKYTRKQSVKRHCLTCGEGTDGLSRNVCNQVPIYAALHPRSTKNSFIPRWKPGITETIGVLNSHEILFTRETRWRSWLRHCAIIRKVAGSIPDAVIPYPSTAQILPTTYASI